MLLNFSKLGFVRARYKLVLVVQLLLFGIFCLLTSIKNYSSSPEDASISVFYSYSAESADPIDYDMGVHHLTMRSIYSSLVSEYTVGKISPDIALDWSSSPDFKKWTFRLDLNRKFESGEKIDPRTVALSMNRMAYLMKVRGSKSGVLEQLEEFDEISSPRKLIKGIAFDEENLYLYFIRPMPKLINKIAFGLYAIVHYDDYNEDTGEWLNFKKINSSGHYKVTSWTEDRMQIEIKPEFKNKGRFETVKFKFKSFRKSDNHDIVVASSEAALSKLGYKFTSRVNSKIRYILCMRWNEPGSFCNERENRIKLRSYIYAQLDKSGLKPVKSFFPLSIEGVSESVLDNSNVTQKAINGKYEISYILKTFTKDLTMPQNELNYPDVIYGAIDSFVKYSGVKINRVKDTDISTNKITSTDLKLDITGILLDSPRDDIVFMFKSKEGIGLPDMDGSIAKVLASEYFNIQEVNTLLWKQGVVWPINHLSFGPWVKKKSKLDLSRINLDLLPADFWWVFHN